MEFFKFPKEIYDLHEKELGEWFSLPPTLYSVILGLELILWRFSLFTLQELLERGVGGIPITPSSEEYEAVVEVLSHPITVPQEVEKDLIAFTNAIFISGKDDHWPPPYIPGTAFLSEKGKELPPCLVALYYKLYKAFLFRSSSPTLKQLPRVLHLWIKGILQEDYPRPKQGVVLPPLPVSIETFLRRIKSS